MIPRPFWWKTLSRFFAEDSSVLTVFLRYFDLYRILFRLSCQIRRDGVDRGFFCQNVYDFLFCLFRYCPSDSRVCDRGFLFRPCPSDGGAQDERVPVRRTYDHWQYVCVHRGILPRELWFEG